LSEQVPQLVLSVPSVSNCSSCCCLPGCDCQWTDWIDMSYPNSSDPDSGDYETFENIKLHNSSWVCAKAENISCRATKFPDIPIADLGQTVKCDVDTGLICNNKDQQIGGIIPMPVCLNYEISVCCVPNIPECVTMTPTPTTSTTSSTTTGISTVSTTSSKTVTPETPSSPTTTTVPPSSTTSSSAPTTTTTITGSPTTTSTSPPV
ncbi:MUC2 protein, partial [Formicarius rufipectus]|nr:MUC2 protein [Formicarius rufipectus]